MSETGTETNGAGPNTGNGGRTWRWTKRVLIGALLVGFGGIFGFAGGVFSAPGLFLHGLAHHEFDAERVAKHIDRRVERVLSRVDATPEQEQKVSAIAKSAVTDLAAQGIKPWETRKKMMELLKADTIDPAAFEALRAEQVSQMDVASKRAVRALTEAASVLTVKQRRELAEYWDCDFPR